MFEQAFRNIDDVLRKEAGCTTELDYTEQSSWLLFLKYLAGLEEDKATEAALDSKKYSYILDKPYRWETWAAPKGKDGKLDHNAALTGDDLRDFVNQKLFPYLHGFKQRATGPDTIEYKIGEIFGEIKNKIQSGYNLREIIDHIDELRFRSQNEKHELSHLYEAKIKNMGNAGRNGGEYYTPRPLIRAIIQVVQPRIGDKIYDGACGSAGFLCESFVYLTSKGKLTTKDLATLQTRTFYGKEKKSLAYVIAIMNMILHGIEAPNIVHTNTLSENLADIQEKDRYDVVLANPPFGGKERPEVQQNFPIRSEETAYLFLQHFIKILKAGGRGGIVIKNTFLSNKDNASVSLRKLLLESCNLHTVLVCPKGTFVGAGVPTAVLFFHKGAPTRKIWFYALDPGRSMGKTNSLNDDDLKEFIELQKTFADSAKSWSVDMASIGTDNYDLSPKNPNGDVELVVRSVQDITDELNTLDTAHADALASIRQLLEKQKELALIEKESCWQVMPLGDICDILDSKRKPITKRDRIAGQYPYYGATGILDYVNDFIFDEPLVLIGEDGAKWGSGENTAFTATGKYWVNNHAHVVRPHRDKLLDDWLIYFLNDSDLSKFVSGMTVPKLNQGSMRGIPIPVPPISDQKRMLEVINELAVANANLKNISEQTVGVLNELDKAILHQAFTGKL